jgi:hypothetical protein
MIDRRSTAQIIADIFGPAPTEQQRSLIVHVALLENRILELEAANETLERQNLELTDKITAAGQAVVTRYSISRKFRRPRSG